MTRIKLLTFLLLAVTFVYGQSDQANETAQPKSTKRHQLGLFTSTMNKSSLSYKIGSQTWYGIVDVGTNIRKNEALVMGVGAGRSFPLSDRSNFNVEALLLAYMFDGKFNEEELDKGFQLGGLYEYNLNKRWQLIGGITYSMIQNKSLEDFESKSLVPSLTDQTDDKDGFGHFVGAKLGVYYRF